MNIKKLGQATIALHAGFDPNEHQKSRAVPIHATTSYTFDDTNHAANLFALKVPGHIYGRLSNPTVAVLEKRLSAYHQASSTLALASGASAVALTALTLCNSNEHFISSPHLYGGTITLFSHTLKRFGINVKYLDLNDEKTLSKALKDKPRFVFAEAMANPFGQIIDLEKVAKIVKAENIPFIVDNTSTPPPILNPFDYGADIVVYSLTKLIGGHGTHLGGAVIEKGDFDWGASGLYPEIDGPDASYHNLNFWEAFGKENYKDGKGQAFTTKIRAGLLRDMGPILSPFGAHEILLGLETLPLRAQQHVLNAKKVAHFLNDHPKVSSVSYPGLASSDYHKLAQKYFPKGAGAVFSFCLKGGLKDGQKFIESVQLCSHLANILDARTLVIHPASTTHQQLSSEEQLAAGITAKLIRISVGIEDVDDIIADLDQALNK